MDTQWHLPCGRAAHSPQRHLQNHQVKVFSELVETQLALLHTLADQLAILPVGDSSAVCHLWISPS